MIKDHWENQGEMDKMVEEDQKEILDSLVLKVFLVDKEEMVQVDLLDPQEPWWREKKFLVHQEHQAVMVCLVLLVHRVLKETRACKDSKESKDCLGPKETRETLDLKDPEEQKETEAVWEYQVFLMYAWQILENQKLVLICVLKMEGRPWFLMNTILLDIVYQMSYL